MVIVLIGVVGKSGVNIFVDWVDTLSNHSFVIFLSVNVCCSLFLFTDTLAA
jgi:hypothetical protein